MFYRLGHSELPIFWGSLTFRLELERRRGFQLYVPTQLGKGPASWALHLLPRPEAARGRQVVIIRALFPDLFLADYLPRIFGRIGPYHLHGSHLTRAKLMSTAQSASYEEMILIEKVIGTTLVGALCIFWLWICIPVLFCIVTFWNFLALLTYGEPLLKPSHFLAQVFCIGERK